MTLCCPSDPGLPSSGSAGEYGQDRDLLGPSYHVFPCKAALLNLLSRANGNAFLHLAAQAASRALGVPALCSLMTYWPAPVEAWRERCHLQGAAFRLLRDVTLLPFFGNSLACRLAEAHEIMHSSLVLGDWRAAQRIEFQMGEGLTRTLVYVVNAHVSGSCQLPCLVVAALVHGPLGLPCSHHCLFPAPFCFMSAVGP